MKQEKQLEKIKIQNQLLKKKTQLTQKEMLVIKKKEQLEKDQKKTQLHNKIQKFRQSISQTQVSELKDRSFIQQSKFQYKQKHYQLKQEKQNANNPLFRKIYRYRDWKDIYSDNNKNDNNSNTVQFNENRLLDDSCQQLNMSNNLIGEQNFSKEILVNDRDPYQNLATYNGDQISNNIHNLNPITSFQTILHRDRNNNTFSNVYSNFRQSLLSQTNYQTLKPSTTLNQSIDYKSSRNDQNQTTQASINNHYQPSHRKLLGKLNKTINYSSTAIDQTQNMRYQSSSSNQQHQNQNLRESINSYKQPYQINSGSIMSLRSSIEIRKRSQQRAINDKNSFNIRKQRSNNKASMNQIFNTLSIYT